jgi:peptide/nickel transport system substrate-binding protein
MKVQPVFIALLFVLLFSACSERAELSTDNSGPKGEMAPVELHLPGGDWGVPTPFTFYPRGPGYIHLSLVYDTLIWKDEKGLIPWLAESWEPSGDGTSWTFHLRSGVRWQDGRPLTARDVRFTFDYLKRFPVEWFTLETIREVEVLDDTSARFHLESAYAPFLSHVAGSVPILPEHLWRSVPDPRATLGLEQVMGSGPYRLVRYDKAQGAYGYEANSDFFLGPPRVQSLHFVPAPDPVAALDRGDVHAAPVPASLLPRFRNDPRFHLLSGPAFWVLTVRLNRDRFPFSENPVRRAFAHLIDRNALIEQAVPGGREGARPGNPGYLPPESRWLDPANQGLYSYDPGRAKALLQSVSIEDRNGDGTCEGPDGEPLRFSLITTSTHAREAEALRLMLHRAGLHTQIRVLDTKTLDALVREGSFDLAVSGRGGLGGDPATIVGFGAAYDGASWPDTPRNPEYLRLARRLLSATDPGERMELCKTMQYLYARELPSLALYYQISHFAYRPQPVHGWFHTAEGGIGIGIPLPYNKLAFLGERKD